FEKILLDAPCSGSGTILLEDKKTLSYFNEKLIAKSCKVQKELLRKGFEHLKVGGTLIYSTCSILKEENENIVLEALKGKKYSIENIDISDRNLMKLPCQIKGALVVMPNEYYEGFFICKIKKCQ
ncbi:MAG: RsmB/NOP family class I SAM-dependent RNA methyltransferase, partial [Bacilli bacterium]